MASPLQLQAQSTGGLLPEHGQVVRGVVGSDQRDRETGIIRPRYNDKSGEVLVLDQATRGAVINWGSFDIGRGNEVRINGASNIVTLNRVVGYPAGGTPSYPEPAEPPTMSQILGSISSPGQVFIINPAGITFGYGASINVSGLVASTLDIADNVFMNAADGNGSYVFQAEDTGSGSSFVPSTIVNHADITANDGLIALIGSGVLNYGMLTADRGTVALAAARSVVLDPHGDGLTRLIVSGPVDQRSHYIESWGRVQADGGQVQMRSRGGGIGVYNSVRANSIGMRKGHIELVAEQGAVNIARDSDAWGTLQARGENAGEDGGSIRVHGDSVIIDSVQYSSPVPISGPGLYANVINIDPGAMIDADGRQNGGHVEISAANTLYAGSTTAISARGGAGNGGQISLSAPSLLAYGAINAAGSLRGGNVLTESTGSVLSLQRIRVDASGGSNGLWRIRAPSLDVIHGSQGQPVTDGPLPAGHSVQDADINRALANGTDVGLETSANGGDVWIGSSVDITAGASTSAQTRFSVDSLGEIRGANFRVGNALAGGAPMQSWFSAANGIDFTNAQIRSAGASIDMRAEDGIGVRLSSTQVDSDGGNVSILGTGSSTDRAGVELSGTSIHTGNGVITLHGTSSDSHGIRMSGGSTLATDSGAISMTGISTSADGISISGPAGALVTDSGNISLAGVGAGNGIVLDSGWVQTNSGRLDFSGRGVAGNGVRVASGASIVTSGGISITGQGGSAAGVELGSGSLIDGGNHLLLVRASNAGNSDAIVLGGRLLSGVGVNLRPGGVDMQGMASDHVMDAIMLGSGNGFALSAEELARVEAPELVIGSDRHLGRIEVNQAIERTGRLSLQNQGGNGGIGLGASVSASESLVLATGGSVTQQADAVIKTRSLLVLADQDVLLDTAANDVSSTTLAGRAGGAFRFRNAGELAIGSVSGHGVNSASNSLSALSADGVFASDNVLIQTDNGDLILHAGVRGTDIDLVTAGRFQNPSNASLSATGDWRVWAQTWEGETRGGLVGDGGLPNLYGCQYRSDCVVSVPDSNNHFIYVQRPVATVTIHDASREYGVQNPVFSWSVDGAVFGDSLANLASGTAVTDATIHSDVGNYVIAGEFASRAGYEIRYVSGSLNISPATLLFTAARIERYLGEENGPLSGTITGFRNADTVNSVFGTDTPWATSANRLSPIGQYSILGAGSARNYVIEQAPGNVAALHVIMRPQMPAMPQSLFGGDASGSNAPDVDSYVYDRNFGSAPMCPIASLGEADALASRGDELSREWAKVRSRPNLSNCMDSERKNSCSDF
ncbi:MAG: MBG domain-containing protein [Pseudomonadota bacterium]|nr:MBG domain-containing protein [Pseudomonadota bacterium]